MVVNNPREFDVEFSKAFNAGDVDELVALYAPDAVLVPTPGSPVTGHDALREAGRQFTSLGLPIGLRTVGVVEGAEYSMLFSDWTISGTGPDGSQVELGGRSTNVLRKQPDGTWLSVLDDPYSSG